MCLRLTNRLCHAAETLRRLFGDYLIEETNVTLRRRLRDVVEISPRGRRDGILLRD